METKIGSKTVCIIGERKTADIHGSFTDMTTGARVTACFSN